MPKKSLTILLPIHNGESRLRRCVDELLELASELTPRFAIEIIDDGSTDATYEVAAELAIRYPQVRVKRYRHRRGLGPTLEAAQRGCRSEVVIVHDGVTSIDPNQVRRLWHDRIVAPGSSTIAPRASAISLDELTDLADHHGAMERAHSRVMGFQLIMPRGGDDRYSVERAAVEAKCTESTPRSPRRGVGEIPSLPRPKFLSALAAFARGE